jgi:hypothetical protein
MNWFDSLKTLNDRFSFSSFASNENRTQTLTRRKRYFRYRHVLEHCRAQTPRLEREEIEWCTVPVDQSVWFENFIAFSDSARNAVLNSSGCPARSNPGRCLSSNLAGWC